MEEFEGFAGRARARETRTPAMRLKMPLVFGMTSTKTHDCDEG